MLAKKIIQILFPLLAALVGGAVGLSAAEVRDAACSTEVASE